MGVRQVKYVLILFIVYFFVFQAPLNMSCDDNNIVLAFKLPYIRSSTSNQLEQAVQSNITTKVSW